VKKRTAFLYINSRKLSVFIFDQEIGNKDVKESDRVIVNYSYHQLKCHIWYSISKALTNKKEAFDPFFSRFSYQKFTHNIGSTHFLNALKELGLDIDELTQEKLNASFGGIRAMEVYDLSELFTYHNMLIASENFSIFDKANSSLFNMIQDLSDYIQKSSSCITVENLEVISTLIKQDQENDGLIKEEDFFKVMTSLSIDIKKNDRNALMLRYDDLKCNRINLLSFIFDLLQVANRKKEVTFKDFPFDTKKTLKEDAKTKSINEKRLVLPLLERLKKEKVSNEMLVSELIDKGRKRRIKMSLVMLKLRELYSDSNEDFSGRKSSRPIQDQAYMNIFDLVAIIDSGTTGAIVDYELDRYLKSFENFEVRVAIQQILYNVQKEDMDLQSYFSECIVQGVLLDTRKLRSQLERVGVEKNSIIKFMEVLHLNNINEIEIQKFQYKIETNARLYKLYKDDETLKTVIYGKDYANSKSTHSLGVDNILAEIQEVLINKQKSFDEVFNYPKVNLMEREEFTKKMNSFRIINQTEFMNLIKLIEDKRDSKLINIGELKTLYDRKYGARTGESLNQKLVDLAVENLKKFVKTSGVDLKTTFMRRDANNTNSLDKRVSAFDVGILRVAHPARRFAKNERNQQTVRYDRC
jgi:hypothetical protein